MPPDDTDSALAAGPARSDGLDLVLRERFGLPALRPWQRDAIEGLLGTPGRALVVAPTGGGKSLTYQLPAVVLGGTSLVVSPLIALMEDQVRALEARGIPATYLASNLEPGERRAREEGVRGGRYRLVYVAPERLAAPGVVERLRALAPPLVAIDEAHCISQWGHDFRPDYLRLGAVLEALRPPRVLACTATATPRVRAEILEKLGMSEADTRVVMRGFARPALHLEAVEIEGAKERRSLTLHAIRDALGAPARPAGAAIVYCATRKATEEVAQLVAKEGWRVGAYHAGLSPDERARVSAAFADRELDVVAATNAFGMGIDRPDIRLVVHWQMPGSIEAYYQEVGRAGRDGEAARGLLLSASADLGLRRRLVSLTRDGLEPDPDEVRRQWQLFLDLLRYVEAGSCRHDFVLRYFGDEAETLGGCGHCDVCERIEEEGERTSSDEDEISVRKALAGVARVRGGAGMTAIAASLVGQADARIERLGLTRLSTHGALRGRRPEWALALLRRLVTAGLVEVEGEDFPVPLLTGRGVRVMKGEEPSRVLVPAARERGAAKRARGERTATGEAPARAALAGSDEALFEALRAARAELARASKMPPYVVCHDKTLVEIARRRPLTTSALREIPGMGPARVELYGARLVQTVRDAARR